MIKQTALTIACALAVAGGGATPAAAEDTTRVDIIGIPGLESPVYGYRDVDGIAHIFGFTERDVVRVQGYVHAQDRIFQMDSTRRLAAGTLSELLGPDALASDVELQTIGLARASERSLAALSPDLVAGLEAYSEGVNYWLATNPLPAEYDALELTSIPEWTALDCTLIGKAIAFNLSFDLDVELTTALGTYQEVGDALGFDGNALFSEDLFRPEPFDPASTVPDATSRATKSAGGKDWRTNLDISPSLLQMARRYSARIGKVPFLKGAASPSNRIAGSNEWGVSGAFTEDGRPIIANDPHLSLDAPSTFYQNHLRARADQLNVIGSSFPGTPFVVLGHNKYITWGATTNPMDVTDMYFDMVVNDPDAPGGIRLVHSEPDDALDQADAIFLTFRFNVIGDSVPDNLEIAPPSDAIPPVAFTIPRRNNGPIVDLDTVSGEALTIQYTGFSGTRELETFRMWNKATNLEEFREGLALFDVGSQNFAYADIDGNLGYFTSAELPLREDLQAGTVNGVPPFFIRDGFGGNEWLRLDAVPEGQTIPYEILPAEEMPQLVNPDYFVNANNDPAGNTLDNDPLNELRPGGGIFYLNPGYAIGTRAGRITQALEAKLAEGPVNREDLQAIQADVVMLDAQVLAPYVVQALANATAPGAAPDLAALGADTGVAEAVGRLAEWDYTSPTGIPGGYDASDVDGELTPPDTDEIAASVAATIYSMWRGQFIGNTIDATLDRVGALAGTDMPSPGSSEAMKAIRHLLDSFAVAQGVGASGLDFFEIDGNSDPAPTRRDILLLQSVRDALDLLAGAEFAPAFAGSVNQDDYRWGKLHRIVFESPLGEPFSTPPAGGLFPAPLKGLSGIPTDGGFGVVDASSHSARADSLDDFMFGSGPVRRYVGSPGTSPESITAETILPGGSSGVLGDPFSVNLLGRWLTNDTYPVRQGWLDIATQLSSVTAFVPEGN